MDLVDKILIVFSLGTWVLYFMTRKNIAFGLAVGFSVFGIIYILGNF